MTDEEYRKYQQRKAEKKSQRLIEDFLKKNDPRALIHDMEGQKGKRKKKMRKRRGY